MRWLRCGFQSLSGWLIASPAGTTPQPVRVREAVRRAMLEALGAEGAAKRPRLAARLRIVRDLQSLWALRTDLMTAIAQAEGEWRAGLILERITELFEGLLPQACGARQPRQRPGMSA